MFVERRDLHVGDAGPEPERLLHAVTGDLVAHDVERDGLVGALASHHHLDFGAARTFEQIGNLLRVEPVGVLVVHLQDDVAGAKTCAVSGRPTKGRDYDGLAVAGTDLHSDAEVVALLIVAETCKIFGIEEIGVRIERAQHPGDGALIDSGVGAYGSGEVLFHHFVDSGELLDAGLEILFRAGSCGRDAGEAGPKNTAEKSAEYDSQKYKKKGS